MTLCLHSEELNYNVHHQMVSIDGKRDVKIRIADFHQEKGWGKRVDLGEILKRITDIHAEVREKNYKGQFMIHKVEICDRQ